MKTSSTKQLRRTILCAIFAGIVAAPFAAQTAYALPIEGANAAANAGEANISTSGTTMDITGKTEHNVLRWEDFSIDSGEKVRFDGGHQTRDYLNLVTGEGASNIYGTIEGGRNVYLVNPHGILFAKGSEVNTGALYLSTANPADIATATNTFKANGTSPLSATAQTGDVLNLGTVKASKLYIEGKNVKVLNTDDVKNMAGNAPLTGTNVTIRSEETPHIGYDVGNKITRNFTINGGTSSKTVSDYASTNVAHHAASAKSRGWDVKKLNGTDAHTDYDYMRVHDVYELQHMDANRVNAAVTGSDKKIIGRYMLANDIAASETKDWTGGFQSIGTSNTVFAGRFDGVGHTITGLNVQPGNAAAAEDEDRGMFGYTKQAVIENVSLKDASVSGEKQVGGIVGTAEQHSIIRNVSFSGEVQGPGTGTYAGTSIGGIVGKLNFGSSIENAYNEGTVEGNSLVGGIVGYAYQQNTIQNVRNAGKVIGNKNLGGIVGAATYDNNIRNALQTGTVEQRSGQSDPNVGGVVGSLDDGSTVTHAVWKEGSVKNGSGTLIRKGVGNVQGNSTATDVEKRSEAQMKLAETYKDWKDGSGKALVATEGGKGTPWRIYDGKTMPLLTALMKGTKRLAKVYDGNVFATTDSHITLVHTGKDVGTYDAYSDQLGYDLIGGAVIKSRVLTMSGVAAQTKTYDGTTAADISKFHATLNNVVSGEESLVTATATGATYNSKDVRAANTVNYTGVALGGTGAGNYTLAASTAQGAGSIKAKQLNLALTSGARFDKTYDGNANVTQTLTKGTNYSLTGFIGTEGDHLALAAATGTYTAGKDAAVNKGVTFDGLSLTGTGAGNYTLDKTTLTGIGTISPKQLNLALTSSARFDKTYDGTANVTQTLTKGTNYTLTNFVNGEGADIALAPVTGTYTDKSAGTGKTVTFGGLTLTGTGAGNYVLNRTSLAGIGTISRRALTLGAVAAQSKTYDGTTSADASKFRAALNNVVAGDSVTTTATGAAYNDKNVAGASTISYTGVGLTGADAGNYTLAATAAQGTGSITHRDLTLTADAKSIAQGEALPSFTGHADGFADGEDESVFGTDTLTFDTAVTNTDRLGSYGVTGRIGSVSEGIRGNYRIRQAAGNATAFTIHAANLLGDIRAANLPGGILAALVQDAAPRFDMGFGQEVYVFGTPRPVRAATLGLYRFDAERGLETQGLNL